MPPDLVRTRRPPVIPIAVPVIDLTTDDENEVAVTLPLRALSQHSTALSARAFDTPRSNYGLMTDASFNNRVAAVARRQRGVVEQPAGALNTDRPQKRRRLDNERLGTGNLRSSTRHNGTSQTMPLSSTSQHHQNKGTPVNQSFGDVANMPRKGPASHQNRERGYQLDQSDQVTARHQDRTTSGIDRRRSSNERLKDFLTARVIPCIVHVVQKYAFRELDAKAVERQTLERLFQHKSLEQQVERTGGQLSAQAWQMLEHRAEDLVARIAAENNVSLRGAKPPPNRRITSEAPAKHEAHWPVIAPSSGLEPDTNDEADRRTAAPARRAPRSGISTVSTYNIKALTARAKQAPQQSGHETPKAKETTSKVKEVRHGTQNQANNHSLARVAEKRARFVAKMSEIMRGRWARGEMDSVVQLRKEGFARRTTGGRLSGAAPSGAPKVADIISPGRSAGKRAVVAREPAEARNIETNIRALTPSSDSSKDGSDTGSALSIPISRSNESQARGYSSSPTTSFSAEGTKESKPPTRSQPPFQLREPYFKSELRRFTVLRLGQAPILQFQRHVRARRRKKQNVEVAAHHERDGLRFASMDPSLDRPYLDARCRSDIARGLPEINQRIESAIKQQVQKKIIGFQGTVLHVDLSPDEIRSLIRVIEKNTGTKLDSPLSDPRDHVQKLMRGRERDVPVFANVILSAFPSTPLLAGRSLSAISAFLRDAAAGFLSEQPAVIRLNSHSSVARTSNALDSIGAMLLNREIHGKRRRPQWNAPCKAQLIVSIEDTISKEAAWMDCAGDVSTITWLPDNGFICGTVTHSDEHNQQYNKPGNLMVGSASTKTLKSIAGHRVIRPIIEKGENSRPEMRETQDPWLYTSVTSTAWSEHHRKCFTGSFDNTVQIWDVCEDRSSMKNLCTWFHDGHVNFVVTSPEHDMIATAADVKEGAIRVYSFSPENPAESEFSVYSGEKADEQALRESDTWAYFPATIQWGKSPSACHLLLVGYSPRSFDPHDEVPELHANTGELCLWNVLDGRRIPITSARTQNVFEVIWHPSQPMFVAGTSPTGNFDEGVNTQLRIFGQTDFGSFSHLTTLDCGALDINEITIMPNSEVKCYVTASCTDGCTYVWDSAEGDQPIRVLRHGSSIDDQALGGVDTDNGVKFAAWGQTADRFYTGSSDGVVKCWNIRAPKDAVLVRDVATLSGGISAGAFSPQFEKLLIGDSTGKVHLFSLDEMEPGDIKPLVIRKTLTPHTELSPLSSNNQDVVSDAERTAGEIARDFLTKGQIVIHEDEYIGAIQGPEYASTNLFAPQEHIHNDPMQRVRRPFRKRQTRRYRYRNFELSCLQEDILGSDSHRHTSNLKKDLDLSGFEAGDRLDLVLVDDGDFTFELAPRFALLNIDEDEEEEVLSATEIKEVVGFRKKIEQEIELQKSFVDFFNEVSL